MRIKYKNVHKLIEIKDKWRDVFMFIYNLKVNGGVVLKIIIVILSIFMLGVFGFSVYKIFFTSGKFVINDKIKRQDITEIQTENYTNILKAVHDDPDSYIGMRVNFTGYIYRVIDFKDNQFVIARDMFINESKTQSVVVGFLCECKDAEKFADGTWVNITGSIEMGKYHNEQIPFIKITDIKEAIEPENSCVMPPSNDYIPTSGMF